ncbi:hypothetical protein ACI65C_004677 [Semiaphis heraclei]
MRTWESLELLRLMPYMMTSMMSDSKQSKKHAVSSLVDDSRPRSTRPSSDIAYSNDSGSWLCPVPDYILATSNSIRKRFKATTSNTPKSRRLSNGHHAVPHTFMPEISTATLSNAHTATLLAAHTATSSDAQESRCMDQQARSMYGNDNETTGYPPYTSIWTPD